MHRGFRSRGRHLDIGIELVWAFTRESKYIETEVERETDSWLVDEGYFL